MPDKECGRLIIRDGGSIDIATDRGKAALTGWSATDEKEICCGYKFTIRCPSDAIDTRNHGDSSNTSQDNVQNLLQQRGRKVGVICSGTYDIYYVTGEVAHGCGGIVCNHYANYFVTPLGPLPGLLGATSGTPNNAPAREALERLKNQPVRYSSNQKRDFLVGYWPWWGNSYTTGSMTWKLVPISGMVLEWSG